MCLPMTPWGPDSVVMKPIFSVSAARAWLARHPATRSRATAIRGVRTMASFAWRAILAQFTALAPTIGRWHRQAQIADLPAADAVGNGQVAEPRLRLPEGVERPGIPSARAAPSGPNERSGRQSMKPWWASAAAIWAWM